MRKVIVILLMNFICINCISNKFKSVESIEPIAKEQIESIDNLYRSIKNTNPIKINAVLNTDSNIPLDTVFKLKKGIELETSPNCLLSELMKIRWSGANIYIQDKDRKELFCFDTTGAFITKLSMAGKGPGEYSEITDFEINSDTIYILDKALKNILLYKPKDFQHIKTISLSNIKTPFYSFAPLPNGYFLLSTHHVAFRNLFARYNIRLINYNGDIVSEHLPFTDYWDNLNIIQFRFDHFNNLVSYCDEVHHKIYRIDPSKQKVYNIYNFNFGTLGIPQEKLSSRSVSIFNKSKLKKQILGKLNYLSDYIIGPIETWESDTYLIFEAFYDKKRIYGFYNKVTKSTLFATKFLPTILMNNLEKNKIFGFTPNNDIVTVFYPPDMIKMLNVVKNEDEEKFQEIMKTRPELRLTYEKWTTDSNPVIIINNPVF